jgi:tripartite-type tricarboxylate transporter receptor subunit TctC
MKRLCLVVSRAVAAVLLASPAYAQSPEGLAKKVVTLYAGAPAGSTIDLYSRLVAQHMGRHLPGNPSVVVSNMPGTLSIACANYLYNVAPKDGSAIGMTLQNIAEEQIFGTEGVRFDARNFGWIGRVAPNVELSYVWHTVPVHSIDDLKGRETIFAVTGPSSVIYPELLNGMIGTRIKLIRGYTGTPAAQLALERGEAEGMAGSLVSLKTTSRRLVQEGKIRVIVVYMPERNSELPDVPSILEAVPKPEDKAVLSFFTNSNAVGRSLIAPPGLASGTLEGLREGFAATMTDPAFLADLKKTGAEFDPRSGEQIARIVGQAFDAPPTVLERARRARPPH